MPCRLVCFQIFCRLDFISDFSRLIYRVVTRFSLLHEYGHHIATHGNLDFITINLFRDNRELYFNKFYLLFILSSSIYELHHQIQDTVQILKSFYCRRVKILLIFLQCKAVELMHLKSKGVRTIGLLARFHAKILFHEIIP